MTIARTPVNEKSWRALNSLCHHPYWSWMVSYLYSNRNCPLRPSMGSSLQHPLCPLWSSRQELKCIAPDSLREWHPPLRFCSGPRRKLQLQISSHVYHPNVPSWLPSLPSVFAMRKEYKGYVHCHSQMDSFCNNFILLFFSSLKYSDNRQLNGTSFHTLPSIFRNNVNFIMKVTCSLFWNCIIQISQKK